MALLETPKSDNRFITWTNWEGYLKFLDALSDRRIKVTFDRGTLELMSPSTEHEMAKKVIGALLECLMEELGVDFRGGGSTTFRREALDRGMEPDECYWIASMDNVNVHERDPELVVPPDLSLEVEVTRSTLNRLGIYAALGVPEVWRWLPEDGGRLWVGVLSSAEGYEERTFSPTFPRLSLAEFERFVRLGIETGQSRAVRSFRGWVRDLSAG